MYMANMPHGARIWLGVLVHSMTSWRTKLQLRDKSPRGQLLVRNYKQKSSGNNCLLLVRRAVLLGVPRGALQMINSTTDCRSEPDQNWSIVVVDLILDRGNYTIFRLE